MMASRPENAAGERNRGIVLPDVDSVRVHFEGQVGSIVEDEGHSVVAADGADEAGPLDERLRLKMLLAQLDDVHPAGDAGRDEIARGQADRVCRDTGGSRVMARRAVTLWRLPLPLPSPSWLACAPGPWPGSRGP